MLRELEDGRRDRETRLAGGHGGEALAFADGFRKVLVEPVLHLRFVVEEVKLRGRADHVEVDGALGFRSKVRQAGESAAGGCGVGFFFAEQRSEGGDAKAAGSTAEELAAGFVKDCAITRVGHWLRASSRFRMLLASMVQAANSGALSFASGFDSPTAMSFFASARWVS